MNLNEFAHAYLDLVQGEFKGINLTRILDTDEFWHKQVLDSVVPFEQDPVLRSALEQSKGLMDVGFGGGFPILPLAVRFPKWSYRGIDARLKKVNVVGQIADRLGLNNVSLEHGRIESLKSLDMGLITIKAVGPIPKLLEMMPRKRGLKVAFYKGPNAAVDELPLLKSGQWELEHEYRYQLEDSSGDRLVYLFKQRK